MKPCLPTTLLLLLALAPATGAATDCGLNIPCDSDGDGAPEAIDCGDFDGDGQLETADVQACYDALTDPKGVRVHVAVPGDYASPVVAGAASFPPGNELGAIEIGSGTDLSCAPGVTLQGWPAMVADPEGVGTRVVYAYGTDGVSIRGCHIDGLMPTEPTDCRSLELGCFSKGRIGVHIENSTHFQLEDLRVSNTQHACIYVARGRNGSIRDNHLENCGGYYLQNMLSYYPGIYLYTRLGTDTAHLDIVGNTVVRHGASAYNTRNNDGQSGRIEDVLWEDNYAEKGRACFVIRGARHQVIRNNTCVENDGIYVHHRATQFCSVTNDHECVSDVIIEGNVVRDVASNNGIFVNDYTENVTLHGNLVEGTPHKRACLRIEQPNRGLELSHNTLRHCGGAGIRVLGDADDPEHGMYWRANRIESTGAASSDDAFGPNWSGVRFEGDVRGLEVEFLEIRGADSHGIDVVPEATLTDTRWVGVTIDGLQADFLGGFSETDAPHCEPFIRGHWIETLSASDALDCSFQRSAPFKFNRCRCTLTDHGGTVEPADKPLPTGLVRSMPGPWGPDELVGGSLVLRPGSLDQEICAIAAHSSDTITCTESWLQIPTPGDEYAIYDWTDIGNQSDERWGMIVRSERPSSGNHFQGFQASDFMNQYGFQWSNEAHDANHFEAITARFTAPHRGLPNEQRMLGALRLSGWMTGTTVGGTRCVDTDPSEPCLETHDARVTYVPEPASGPMLLAGAGAILALSELRRGTRSAGAGRSPVG